MAISFSDSTVILASTSLAVAPAAAESRFDRELEALTRVTGAELVTGSPPPESTVLIHAQSSCTSPCDEGPYLRNMDNNVICPSHSSALAAMIFRISVISASASSMQAEYRTRSESNRLVPSSCISLPYSAMTPEASVN